MKGALEFGHLTRAIPTGLHPTAQGCCTQLPWVSVRFDANLERGCGIAARGAWGLRNPFRVRANMPRAPKVAEYGNLGLCARTPLGLWFPPTALVAFEPACGGSRPLQDSSYQSVCPAFGGHVESGRHALPRSLDTPSKRRGPPAQVGFLAFRIPASASSRTSGGLWLSERFHQTRKPDPT